MRKSTFTPEYELLRARLVALRRAAGFTQRGLAERLGREQSFVGRLELGERRVDLLEFYWICAACGQSPEEQAQDLMALWREMGLAVKTVGSRRYRLAEADRERLIARASEAPEPYQAAKARRPSRGRIRKG